MSAHALVAAAKKRLLEIEERLADFRDLQEEKEELLAVLKRHGAAAPEKSSGSTQRSPRRIARVGRTAPVSDGSQVERPAVMATSLVPKGAPTTLAQQRGARAFQKLEGGPTETILELLRGSPSGMTYAEVVEGAVKDLKSNATNPRKSVGNVLLSLKKRRKVAYHDGKYYAPLT